ncbi:DNA mismatch repair protein MutS [Flavobacterium magnum]|uniref:DNA mismatch repair protein MutS n=1 Tax=Flavobacterium magnum TaxID=2162713 RepID=A0A2S0RGS7_9FLAO|nr:Smr/MutS family protein [Flavobacterium magnum]AWA30500.1 DNA mismatch repair protein MutS [Flavobacterium magnum]
MYKKGDKVMVLDDDIEGIVMNVQGESVTVETTEGFELTFHQKELLLVGGPEINFTTGNISQILKEKEIPKPRSFVKEKKVKEVPVPEFDLHIEKLVKNPRGMNNFDILNLQIETAKRHVDFAISHRIPKIVFIHGVGEGVLKAELDFLLGRYDNLDFQDASYQKYGAGATEIYFRQNKKA